MPANNMGYDPSTFPNLTRDAMLKERAQKETSDFQNTMLSTAALLPQKDRGMFISAGSLGRGIAKAIAGKGTQLAPKEVQGLAIMENANKGMRKLQASPEWAGYSAGMVCSRTAWLAVTEFSGRASGVGMAGIARVDHRLHALPSTARIRDHAIGREAGQTPAQEKSVLVATALGEQDRACTHGEIGLHVMDLVADGPADLPSLRAETAQDASLEGGVLPAPEQDAA